MFIQANSHIYTIPILKNREETQKNKFEYVNKILEVLI